MRKGKSVLTGKLTRRTILRNMGYMGLGMAGVGLAGCTTTTTAPTTTATTAATGVTTAPGVRGGTFNFSTTMMTLADPRFGESMGLGFYGGPWNEPLLSLDLDWNTVGILAEDMLQLDDVTYRFKLRENVKFHDGTEFTSTDAKTNLEFCAGLIPDQVAHRYIGFFKKISGADIVDTYTVDATLSEPWAYAIASLPLLNPTYIMKDVDARSSDPILKPAGTGPYKITDYVEGSHISYERFDDWWGAGLLGDEFSSFWGGEQYFDDLNYKCIIDEQTRLVELETGTIDCMYYRDNTVHELVKANSNLDWTGHAGAMATWMFFNVTKKPGSDIRWREAVIAAVDWEAAFNAIYPKDIFVQDAFMGSPYEDANLMSLLPDYDPDHAMDLVEEIESDDGTVEAADIIMAPGPGMDMFEIVISYLNDVGIPVDFAVTDNAGSTDVKRNRLFTIDTGYEMFPAVNVWVWAYVSFSASSGMSYVDGKNWAGVDDPVLEPLVTNIMKYTNPEDIHDDVVAIGQRVYEQRYQMPMRLENRTYAFTNNLKGFQGEGCFRRGFPITDVWKT